jgi:hypothetical protein
MAEDLGPDCARFGNVGGAATFKLWTLGPCGFNAAELEGYILEAGNFKGFLRIHEYFGR